MANGSSASINKAESILSMCFKKLIRQKVENYLLTEKMGSSEAKKLIDELTEIHYEVAKQDQFKVGHMNIINKTGLDPHSIPRRRPTLHHFKKISEGNHQYLADEYQESDLACKVLPQNNSQGTEKKELDDLQPNKESSSEVSLEAESQESEQQEVQDSQNQSSEAEGECESEEAESDEDDETAAEGESNEVEDTSVGTEIETVAEGETEVVESSQVTLDNCTESCSEQVKVEDSVMEYSQSSALTEKSQRNHQVKLFSKKKCAIKNEESSELEHEGEDVPLKQFASIDLQESVSQNESDTENPKDDVSTQRTSSTNESNQ